MTGTLQPCRVRGVCAVTFCILKLHANRIYRHTSMIACRSRCNSEAMNIRNANNECMAWDVCRERSQLVCSAQSSVRIVPFPEDSEMMASPCVYWREVQLRFFEI